jgi:bacteriocin biosynthesis cyclodehydratase domain-containing protein
MSISPSSRPRIPGHYYIRCEPPDTSGDELLFFDSERRKVKLKGSSFREFLRSAVPLMDGTRTLAEIQSEVAGLFDPEDLERSLKLLAEYDLIEDAAQDTLASEVRVELAPQLNFFHELRLKSDDVQRKLGVSTVAVWGLGGPGAWAALALAAAGVGTLRCVDTLPTSRTDTHLVPLFASADVGQNKAEVVRAKIRDRFPKVDAIAFTDPVASDVDAIRIIEGTDLVVCCADAGMSTLFYILNRACLKAQITWTSCSVSGFEGIIGPTVVPYETACYLCYKMRAAACAANPEDELAHLRRLDRRKRDDSDKRENHPFSVGAVGNLVGLEAIKCLTRIAEPSALRRIVVVDFLTLVSCTHTVLRMPWCPACSPEAGAAEGSAAADRG